MCCTALVYKVNAERQNTNKPKFIQGAFSQYLVWVISIQPLPLPPSLFHSCVQLPLTENVS